MRGVLNHEVHSLLPVFSDIELASHGGDSGEEHILQ